MSRRPKARPSPASRGPDPLPAVAAGLSALYVAMVAWVIGRRMAYPFELEWIEGAMLDHVARLLRGEPLYVPPSIAWVPLNYTPLYPWLGAALAKVFGLSFPVLRLLAAVSSAATAVLLWLLVRHETGRRAPAWLAVGLFAATFRLGGAWLDVARPDSLQLALVLAGALVARQDPSRWRMPLVGGTLFALAFLAKQSAPVMLLPLLAYLVFADWRRGLALAGTFALLSAASAALLDATTHGEFRYYVYTVPSFHKTDLRLLGQFPLHDVLRPLWPSLLMVVLAWTATRRGERPFASAFSGALAFGFIALAWWLRLYRGGYQNVLIPAYVALALIAALAFARATGRPPLPAMARSGRASHPASRWVSVAACALVIAQLAILAWNPAAQIPTEADRAVGDRLVAGLRALPGRIYVSGHPYLLARAGRPTHAHVMPLMDVMRDGHGRRERALLETVRDSLAAHAWDVLVMDQRDWLIDEALRAGYRQAAVVIPEPDVFWPVTGMRTRPQFLMAAAGDSAAHPVSSAAVARSPAGAAP